MFLDFTVACFTAQVLKGGNLDVDMEVKSPKGKTLYHETRRQRDAFPLEVSIGTFSFCFGNEFSSLTHKVVHFSVKRSGVDTRALQREVNSADIKPGVNTLTESAMESIHEFATKVYNGLHSPVSLASRSCRDFG